MIRPSQMRQRTGLSRAGRPLSGLFGLSRLRMIEIGVALLLTLAAGIFVGLKVWAAESLGIHVTEAWARPSVGQGTTTAAYMTIVNDGVADDVLKSARSPNVKAVEVHQTSMTPDGVMQMRQVKDGLPIPAGGSLALTPGGTHLMLIGLQEPLQAGGEVTLTLEFADAAPIDVAVPAGTGPATADKK
jgi:copper(I)-binding protein